MAIPKNCDSCGFFSNGGQTICRHDDAHGVEILDINELPDMCPIKEDTLPAERHRVKYRGEDFYLCVVIYRGGPWEVFVEHAIKGKQSLQYMMAGWDTATRFITRDLKREPLSSVIRQLDKASRQKNDLPNVISTTLRKWL